MVTKKQFKKSLNKKNKKVNSTKKNKKHYRKKTRLNKLKNSYNGGANEELQPIKQTLNLQIKYDDIAKYINSSNIVVDPAGTAIEHKKWSGSGVSGVIYSALGLLIDDKQPPKNIDKSHCIVNGVIDDPTKACTHTFKAVKDKGDITIIHVHSPDGNKYKEANEFQTKLKDSYKNIFDNYASINNFTKPLILIQVSGAIYSGVHHPNMPKYTIKAIYEGFEESTLSTVKKPYEVKLINNNPAAIVDLNYFKDLYLQIPKEIYHYWFKQWPDHGVPDFTGENVKTTFDTFITTLYTDIKDNENNKDNTTVIHCSAGIGRSGVVYVILSILFKHNFVSENIVLDSETVLVKEIIDTITRGRQHRHKLVQTLDQCKFIFNYLLSKINFTNTLVTPDNTIEQISDNLVTKFNTIGDFGTGTQPGTQPGKQLVKKTICGSGNMEFKNRNRYSDILPYNDETRVVLNVNVRQCDYINASHMIDFSNKERTKTNKVIITQCPTEYTIPHFYLMLHQQKVKRIVMVTNLVEGGKLKCNPYITNTDKLKPDVMSDMGKNVNEFKSTLVLTPTNNTFTLMDTAAQSAKAAQEKAAQVLQEAQEKEKLEKEAAQAALEKEASQSAQEKKRVEQEAKDLKEKEAKELQAKELQEAQEKERLEKKAKLEKEAAQAALEKEASQSAQEKKRVEQEAKDLKEKEAKELQAKELQEAQEKAAAQAAQAANAELEKEKAKAAQPQPKKSICELLRLYKPKSKKRVTLLNNNQLHSKQTKPVIHQTKQSTNM